MRYNIRVNHERKASMKTVSEFKFEFEILRKIVRKNTHKGKLRIYITRYGNLTNHDFYGEIRKTPEFKDLMKKIIPVGSTAKFSPKGMCKCGCSPCFVVETDGMVMNETWFMDIALAGDKTVSLDFNPEPQVHDSMKFEMACF